VGLLPGGGGCKEFAVRARRNRVAALPAAQIDMLPVLRAYFQTIATATVAKSALEAQALAYLKPSDVVVPNCARGAARRQGRGARRARPGYRAAASARRSVAGRTGLRDAQDDAGQHARRRLISAYDRRESAAGRAR